MGWNKLNRAGFTILEVLVAIFIISFGLLALIRALSGGLMGSKKSHDVTVATLLAQGKMEETRAAGYPDTGTTDDTFAIPHDNFEWEMTVDSTGTTNLREISLSVYWPAANGSWGDRSKQRCLQIRTYLAKYD